MGLEVVDHDIGGVTGKWNGQVINERVQSLVMRMLDLHAGGAQARYVHEALVPQDVLLAREEVGGRQAGDGLREQRREVLVGDDRLQVPPDRLVAVDDDVGRVVLGLSVGRQQGPVDEPAVRRLGRRRRVRVGPEDGLQV